MPNLLSRNSTRTRRMTMFGVLFGIIGISAIIVSHAAPTASISGTFYKDTNRNGVQDAGEEPQVQKYIYLFNATTNAYIRNSLTDASGRYTFDSLEPGSYQVLVAPSSWNSYQHDWVATTTGNLSPTKTLSVDTTAKVDFGIRQIVRTTDRTAPISTYTGANGIKINSYDDVVPAKELYDLLIQGTLVGKEAQYVTIDFDYGTSTGYTSSRIISTNGVPTDFKAGITLSYDSWLRTSSHGDELFHEYGHAWSQYYANMVQNDPSFQGYLTARGLANDSRVNTTYAWSTSEMIAEDYRQLFGTPAAQSGSQTNADIPLAKNVPGLKEYLSGSFMASSADTIAPSTPTGLTATPSLAGEGPQVQVKWTASTDNKGIARYDVYRNGLKVGSVYNPATTYADVSGLSYGTTYSYAVTAVDAAGNTSAKSTSVSVVTPPADTVAPSAPSALSSPSQTLTSIALTWNASSDNTGISEYRIYQLTGTQKNTYTTQVGSTSATNFTVNNLKRGTSYSFYVVAIDTAGNQSPPSATLNVKTKR
jgi:chitodextrinase